MNKHIHESVVICGLPGVGKTTVGKHLAKLLNREFIDTDLLIEQRCGMSCREYFQRNGEGAFRDLEKEMIFSLKKIKSAVIALGGGVVEIEEVIEVIPSLGVVIHIRNDIDLLIQRKVIQDTPAMVNDEKAYRQLAGRRLPLLNKIANIEITCNNKCLDDISLEIIESFYLSSFKITSGIRRNHGE